MKIGLFSFFSGAGFLDFGFESLMDYQVLRVSEINNSFLDAYRYARKQLKIHEPVYGFNQEDIRDSIREKQLMELKSCLAQAKNDFEYVGFIGGPPCPDFSVGGKNRGREGDNGKLSETYAEMIVRTLPDFFLFENVKGLWKTKTHRMFFEELKVRFTNAGYSLDERLVNAIEYGAPQDRERIILIGMRNDIVLKKANLLKQNGLQKKLTLNWQQSVLYPLDKVFTKNWPEENQFIENRETECPRGVIKKLTVQHWFEQNGVENHPNAKCCFKPRNALIRFQTIPEGDVSKKSFKRLHRWRYSPTAAYGNNEVHLHPYRARRLSVAEALAIQSLPPTFLLPPEGVSLTDKFKMVGNGVPFLVAQGLAVMIKSFLGQSEINFNV